MKVTILGCGPSTGVPAIGPDWGDCDPGDPRNRRRRASILIQCRGKTILIDTSPDLREQLLDAAVTQLDAVILTHAHADHLHGIDDLRSVNRLMKRAIPLYADAATTAELRARFGYVFDAVPSDGLVYKPHVEPHVIDGPFTVADIGIVPFVQDHGFSKTLGFRIGPLGYSTDVVELDEAAFAALAGIAVWIVDCLKPTPHPTHSDIAKTLGWVARLRPKRAVLTHMDRQLDYARLAAQLPVGVEPAHDGLVIELPDP